jgi:nitrate/nitrite-specific signal transduction histidine kinase
MSFGFFVIVLCLMFISVLGYLQLVHTNDDTDIIVKDRLVKVNLAHTIENEINRQSRALRTAILAQDKKVIDQELKKIESSKPLIQQSLQKLSETVQTAEGKAGLARILKARQEFIQHEDQLVQLIKNGRAEKGERIIVWMAVFSFIASILISVVTTRSIVDPLKRLQQGMKEVERTSNFSQRIQVSGADEVGQASRSFNDMLSVQQNAFHQCSR